MRSLAGSRSCVPSRYSRLHNKRPCVLTMASASFVSSRARQLALEWLQLDKQPHTRQEVQAWLDTDNEAVIMAKLGKRLEFGTAGLRGCMGAGYNAMNLLTVQQTTQGLCRYLQQVLPSQLQQQGIVIGFDARHNSHEFALVAAAVFLSQNVPVHLFSSIVPTPFVAAGVAELQAAAGVMVTASHNPKQDNGYKVYFNNGCQIIPPHDEGIAAAIEANLPLWELPVLERQHPQHPLLSDPLQQVMSAYYSRLVLLSARGAQANASAAPVTYTPLHGVGGKFLLKAFESVGLPSPHVVAAQQVPDPEFPTVVFPNPEEGAGTWALAFQEGQARGDRLVIANDPDADRLAVAEADASAPGGYHAFSGNEIGALLAHWLWAQHRQQQPDLAPSKCVMLASVVSSAFLGAMAAKEGFNFVQTLTGFKWLGNRALELEAQGLKVIFAYEEAIGFMPGPMYRDKDGISAAMCIAELAAHLYSTGSSLLQQLQHLYTMYGTPQFRSGYFIADQPAKSRAVFARLRQDGQYPQAIGGAAVTWIRDLGTGLDTAQSDRQAVLPWRSGDMMITFGLAGGAVLTLRASGTEPKLKYYLEVLSDDTAAATALADALVVAVDRQLVQVDASGLARPAHSQ